MINEKLLSEIFDLELYGEPTLKDVILYIDYKDLECEIQPAYRTTEINIYELAHKCKAWAISKARAKGDFSFTISTVMASGISSNKLIIECKLFSLRIKREDGNYNSRDNRISFKGNTEPEAVFQACEWIFKQKEKHEFR